MSYDDTARRVCFRRVLPSRLDAIDAVCHDVRAFVTGQGESSAGFVIELVVRECLNNAVLHGNRQDPAKSVTLSLALTRRHFCLAVQDEGRGFPWHAVLGRPIPDDMAVRGRGLPILEMYARKVTFNKPGNSVTVWLRRTCTEE